MPLAATPSTIAFFFNDIHFEKHHYHILSGQLWYNLDIIRMPFSLKMYLNHTVRKPDPNSWSVWLVTILFSIHIILYNWEPCSISSIFLKVIKFVTTFQSCVVVSLFKTLQLRLIARRYTQGKMEMCLVWFIMFSDGL